MTEGHGAAVCESLQRMLALLKDRLGRRQGEWEAGKGACNPYERIPAACLPCVCDADGSMRHPTSRAFFKIWELAAGDAAICRLMSREGPVRCAYAAEAPGSFVEAVVTMRRRAGRGGCGDRHGVITLVSDDRSVPRWKLAREWMHAFGVSVSRGADGTGDVTGRDNVSSFIDECGGPGSCDLFTGDGGFDFSADFNGQERQVFRLLAAEVLLAARLLRPGGCAVIKVFDAFHADTVALLASLASLFEGAELRKPRASRPGNSERYMVCSGYRGGGGALCRAIDDYMAGARGRLDLDPVDPEAERRLVAANARHAASQVEHLLSAMDAMERQAAPATDLSPAWVARYLPWAQAGV